jgi:hypothetical protein
MRTVPAARGLLRAGFQRLPVSLELLEHFADGERLGTLPWRILGQRLEPIPNDGGSRYERECVMDAPFLIVEVTGNVGILEPVL